MPIMCERTGQWEDKWRSVEGEGWAEWVRKVSWFDVCVIRVWDGMSVSTLKHNHEERMNDHTVRMLTFCDDIYSPSIETRTTKQRRVILVRRLTCIRGEVGIWHCLITCKNNIHIRWLTCLKNRVNKSCWTNIYILDNSDLNVRDMELWTKTFTHECQQILTRLNLP